MGNYYLAVDIGASSGRHILGSITDGRICLEEVYRFENKLIERAGHLCWDIDALFVHILTGMACCAELGKAPYSMGIDTWGVDFVLLDGEDKRIGDAVAYRDNRTQGIAEKVFAVISEQELYTRTGIQRQPFNTINQLYSLKLMAGEELTRAKRLLMIPEYFNFLLTGEKKNEYTNATTTQLVKAHTRQWDKALLKRLDFPPELFGTLHTPQTVVGCLKKEVAARVGFDCTVLLPATHDTGSAFLAVPAQGENSIFLSSGTWSLIGVERNAPDCREISRVHNFTNEGGYGGTIRYLKNIMGLWMIQSVKKELGNQYSFDELCQLAQQADCDTIIDVSDVCFLAPRSMIQEIKTYCACTGKPVPQTVGELVRCVYHSLAKGYADAVFELEELTRKKYTTLHLVGGGSKDTYLNALTAQYTQKKVYAGPAEATALGNLLVQMLSDGVFADVAQARRMVADSFEIQKMEDKTVERAKI